MAGTNLALTATDLTSALDAVLAHYKELAPAAWSVERVYSLATRLIATLVTTVARHPAAPAELNADDLKATVLAAFDKFYDDVIAPLDIPFVPNFIETRWVDPMLKAALHKQVSGIFDAVLKILGQAPALTPGDLPPPATADAPADPPKPPALPGLPTNFDPY